MATVETSPQQTDAKGQLNNSPPITHPESLNFDECFKDSPKFRQNLKDNLNYIEILETYMSKTIKNVSNYIETGRDHVKSQKDLIQSLKSLNSILGNIDTSKRVNSLLETLEEISRLHEIVIDQSARTIGTSLTGFINEDLYRLKEARKSFDKIGHEYDLALTKSSQPVKKQHDDSENILIATSTAFTHTSLDLSIQVTTLQSKKNFDILSSLLSFLKAHSTFFHQGYDLFEDLKPHISDMDEYLINIEDEFENLMRSLPSKHLMVSNNQLRPLCFDNSSEQVQLEGYLFKRASNGFKIWNRRWFILKNHQLLYQKRGEPQPTIMEEDLRLLTVRPIDRIDYERRFCFEVLSPHKSHLLQADSEQACKTWISAIQAGINAAFQDTEHKSLQNVVVPTNPSNVPNSSSWSSGFSFKALQQQATSRLNSIATINDSKLDNVTTKKTRSKGKSSRQRSEGTSCEEDEIDSGFKIDEEGRSYARLQNDDDDECDKHEESRDQAPIYPEPANLNQDESIEASKDPPEKPQRAYMIILAMPGNDTCADCGASQPRWASVNLGITLCIECAGIHRSLGVHLSKVRSLTLDTGVWSPEIVQLMLNLGNSQVNSAYLACYRGEIPQINSESSREEREIWIKKKYLLKSFMRPPGEESSFTEDQP